MNVTFGELLSRDGKLVYKTCGVSMEPMLRQNRDLVVIEVPVGRLKPMDVAFYKRGDKYVLHRVIKTADSYYLIRGDNTYVFENVPDSAVIGVLTGFQRKGRQYAVTDRRYLMYARFWNAIYPLRSFLFRVRRFAILIARKLGILPLIKKYLKKA